MKLIEHTTFYDALQRVKVKVSNRRGDTLVETLVALTIVALALILLSMAISVGSKMVKESATALHQNYDIESQLAAGEENADCQGTVSVSLSNGQELLLTKNEAFDISYCTPADQSAAHPAVSYSIEKVED